MTPVVTALRQAGRGRVAVELDGSPWRVLPAEPVLAAGLDVGVALDRERVRRLRAELRRVEARGAALSALSRADHTTASLRARLTARGVAPADREAALATVTRAGLVDDARFATVRAAALAERDAGDALIRDDLERRGVAAEVIEDAIAVLEPELDAGTAHRRRSGKRAANAAPPGGKGVRGRRSGGVRCVFARDRARMRGLHSTFSCTRSSF